VDSSAELAGTAERAGAADADQALARRIAAGDVDAWDRFFERYAVWAYRFAYRHLGGNHADAQDLCSEIMMTAARSIRQFDASRGTLDSWLLGVARHRLARFCRSRRLELPLVPDLAAANPVPNLPDTDSAHTRDLVNRALASLPQRQAAVLVGKYMAGYTTEELARHSEITPKAVESLLSRARAAFRSVFSALLESSAGGDCRG
jgi:RNA polymerase sigma-70 factor (ECF subfamily)